VALLPGQIGWWNPQSTGVQSSPVHWTETGLQVTFQSPVEVQGTESPVRVQWSPVESTGLLTEFVTNIILISAVQWSPLDWTGWNINTLFEVALLLIINTIKKAKS
jgi:hypothetical protein